MKKRIVYVSYVFGLMAVGLLGANWAMSRFYGLGNPIIYDDNPVYGYRPIPNQSVTRFNGKRIHINNIGLRCDFDWDTIKSNKLLILGNSVTYGGSYIDNSELFSTLLTKDNDTLQSGCGGVNGWGVNNIHGLVVKHGFRPAKIYLSVLIEGDFYRGLSGIGGTYNATKKPISAIHEVVTHYLTSVLLSQKGHHTGDFLKDKKITWEVYDDAMRHLKEMDDTLKAQGYVHHIFISPTADQVFRKEPVVPELLILAKKYGVSIHYLLDDVRALKMKEKEIFHDNVHLEAEGHKCWAEILKKYLLSKT